MLPITKKITKYNHREDNTTADIQYIVIHDTGNVTDSDEGNANYFSADGRNASAHYFVDDNSITQVVEDKDIAWHVGDGAGKHGITNKNSIGIEMCRVNGTVTELTEANTIELVKMLMAKYNIRVNNIVRHYDASRKNCPSSFSANNWARWIAFKSKLGSTATVSKILKLGSKGQDVVDLQTKLQKLGYPLKDIDGDFGLETENAVKLFQRDKGLTVDGIVGKGTFEVL